MKTHSSSRLRRWRARSPSTPRTSHACRWRTSASCSWSAIDSPSGAGTGVLIGQHGKGDHDRIQCDRPDPHRRHDTEALPQPGCSRLNVRFSQDGVQLPGAAAPATQTVDIGLNYCRDGMPPKSLS